MSSVKTYNPRDIVVIAGFQRITGFSESDIVEIKPRGDGIKPYDGADGEVGRAIDPNRGLEVTINLAGTSMSNDILSAFYEADEHSGNAMFTLAIKDLSGSTIVAASQAWVAKVSDTKFGKKIESRKWTIQTGEATFHVGGGSES